MTEVFLEIVNMSLSATYLVLAVVVLRFVLKKAPKWVNVLLWGLVAFRLVCPFTLESALSLIPSAEVVSPEIMMDAAPEINTGIQAVNRVVNPVITGSFAPESVASVNPLQIWIPVLAILWCIGMGVMLLYTAVTYCRLRHRVRMAIRVKGNIYLSEHVSSPFVLGIFKPRIYLPYHMSEQDRHHVIAHERAHIRRKDHLWKPLGFLLLTVHWFNPVMWLAYILLCRDIELACDEKVIKELGMEQRADYSEALLHCSISHRSIAACPIAFGEVGVRQRVKNVLNYKKPAFWVIVICLVIVAIVSVCFLTDPLEEERDPTYGLIHHVLSQEGHTITDQESKKINLVIEKDKLPNACFTEKGYTFEICELIPYETGTANRLYLKHVSLDADDPSYIRFTFDFRADSLDNGKLLLPYYVDIEGNGYVCNVTVNRGEVWDNQGTYPDAAIFEPVTNGEGFCVLVKADIYQNAGHHIAFMLNEMNLLSYEVKEPAAPVSISLDNVSSTGLTMLFHQDQSAIDGPLKVSNDYFLEENVDGEWLEVPRLIQPKFMEDALDVSSLHHYGIDWTNLYGPLPDGSYRIAKPVPISSDSDERVVLYAEFTIGNHGISLTAEDVTPVGMTVFFHPEDTLQQDHIITENKFWLETYSYDTTQWSILEPTNEIEPELAGLTDRTIQVVHDLPRGDSCLALNWSTLYGELPMGRYRAATELWIDSEPYAYYAEFYISGTSKTPHTLTSALTSNDMQAQASYADGGGYVFDKAMKDQITEILNGLTLGIFTPTPGITPETTITLTTPDCEIILKSDGEYVEFSFDEETAKTYGSGIWAVESRQLNEFFATLNSYSPANSTYEIYNVAPLEELPASYSLEEATIDKVVILSEGDIRDNQDVWEAFLASVKEKNAATVRIMKYYMADGAAESVKRIYDLSYDGSRYTLSWSDGNGGLASRTYQYLLHADKLTYPIDRPFDAASCYYLTDNPQISLSIKDIDEDRYIDPAQAPADTPMIVYSDLIVYPDYAPIPDAKEISLEADGSTFMVLVDENAVETVEALFASGKAIGFQPATYFPGPQMVFHGKDGSKTTITLDLESDMFIHDGLFYDYGKPDYPDLEALFILFKWVYWPEEVTEHDSFRWYFENIPTISDTELPGVWCGNVTTDGSFLFPKGQQDVQLSFHKYGKGQYTLYTSNIQSIGVFSYRIEADTLHINVYNDKMYEVPYRIEDGFLYLTLGDTEISLFRTTESTHFLDTLHDPQRESDRLQKALELAKSLKG